MGDQATGFFSDRKRRVYTRVIIATRRLRALGVTLIRSNREQKETAGNRDPGSSHSRGREGRSEAGLDESRSIGFFETGETRLG